MRIGLVLNVLDEEYQISVYRGIKNKALEMGVDLLCFQHKNTRILDDPLILNYTKSDNLKLDGIILLTSVLIDSNDLHTKEDVEKIWGKIPIVSIGQKIPGIPSFLIQTDDSMKQLVEHLILQHEYRKFFFISGPQNHHDAIVREDIFKKTMEAYKPWIKELSYKIKHGYFTQKAGLKIMEEYYAENPGDVLDAVVCANDNIALGVYKFFQIYHDDPGIKECAVTGFDDIPQAKFEIPAFTTIRQPMLQSGVEGFLALIDMINGKECKQESYVESEFVIRDSCGCNVMRNDAHWQDKYIHQIQTKYVQSEHYLNLVSHVNMDLNYPESLDELKDVINNFVEQLGVKDFCVLVGKDKLKPLYVRSNNKYYDNFCNNKEISMGEFYQQLLNERKNQSSSLIFNNLYSGKELVGLILYDGSHNLLPHLCNLIINVSQAIARIQNAEEKERRSEYLEQEVTKRTKELVEANNKRMEVEAEVLQISEMERQRFSTDLHDDICQRLAGISMMCRCYANQDKAVEKKQMAELAGLISDTLQATRQYAHNSYPVELESLGLKDSIGNLCDSFEKQQNINCQWNWSVDDDSGFDKLQKLNIFRIIQEALHNVSKHSKAHNVKVELVKEKSLVQVRIVDDGVGVTVTEDGKIQRGLGLNSMEYRANQIGAVFEIRKNDPAGTCIEVQLKLE